ncbi:MAG: hypothetical protein AB4352_28435 [Hormoscilla sp.]
MSEPTGGQAPDAPVAARHQMHRLGFVLLPNLRTADGVIYGAKSPIGT